MSWRSFGKWYESGTCMTKTRAALVSSRRAAIAESTSTYWPSRLACWLISRLRTFRWTLSWQPIKVTLRGYMPEPESCTPPARSEAPARPTGSKPSSQLPEGDPPGRAVDKGHEVGRFLARPRWGSDGGAGRLAIRCRPHD